MSDASEVKAAAERLRRNVHAYDPDGQEKQRQDIAAVLNDWWAEHDETPIDPDWLKSVGANVAQQGAYAALTGNGMELLVTEHGFYLYDLAHGIDIPALKTRGEVRRLCAVLGIELKESSK